jgi:glutamate carboxypeptidase
VSFVPFVVQGLIFFREPEVPFHHLARFLAAALLAPAIALSQPMAPILEGARAEKAPLLDTLKELTAIESGSRDYEGLEKIGAVVFARLKALGAEVEMVEPADVYKMEDTPERIGRAVRGTFKGKGTKKILLIAHMDTVYAKGQGAQQPFRVDGNKAYGLGIADDKQGIAVILHSLAILKRTGFDEYGTITVLVNGDEEVSTPGHRALITRLASEHDAVMSFEGGGTTGDQVRLATAGIGAVLLKVKGRASHAGSAPQNGVNALYELSHQIMQMRDYSGKASDIRMNWTVSKAGFNRNVIPFEAEAMADVRVQKVSEYDFVEQFVRERVKNQLFPESKIEVFFERAVRRSKAPPPVGRLRRSTRRGIFQEVGQQLNVATGLDRRRHRCRLRGAKDQEPGGRRLRIARLWRALQRRRIHPHRQHRAAALPHGADDHGLFARESPRAMMKSPGNRQE